MATSTNPNYGSSGTDVSTTWSSDANAYDTSTTTEAVSSSAVTTHIFEVGGYLLETGGANALPTDAVITNIAVTTWHYCSNVARFAAPSVRAYNSTTALGTGVVSMAESTSATNSETVNLTGTFNRSDVANANFKIRFSHQQTSTSGTPTTKLRAISVVVTYTTTPVASFTISDNAIWTADSVNFTDTSTNTPTGWSWNFGTNATPATSTSQSPTGVTWSTTGAKTITMTATNAAGSDAADNGTVTVYATIDANFSADDTTPTIGQNITFTDSSTNTPTTWSWNFGTDSSPGTASTQGPHTVSYSASGDKTVTLTAGNAGGTNLETKTNYLTVAAGPVFAIHNGTSWREDFEIYNGTSWRADFEIWNGTRWVAHAVSQDNLLSADQASLEGSIANWYSSSSTVSRSTDQASHGTYSLKMVANGGIATASTTTGTGGIAVSPSTVYTIYGEGWRSTGTTGTAAGVYVNWYTSAGAATGTQDEVFTDQPNAQQWYVVTGSFTSPSNAAYVALRVTQQDGGTGNPTAGDVYYWDKMGIWTGTSTTWVL